MSLFGIYLEFVGMRANLLVPNALCLRARCYLLADTEGEIIGKTCVSPA